MGNQTSTIPTEINIVIRIRSFWNEQPPNWNGFPNKREAPPFFCHNIHHPLRNLYFWSCSLRWGEKSRQIIWKILGNKLGSDVHYFCLCPTQLYDLTWWSRRMENTVCMQKKIRELALVNAQQSQCLWEISQGCHLSFFWTTIQEMVANTIIS